MRRTFGYGLMLAVVLTGCKGGLVGSGQSKTEVRTVAPFTAVDLSGAYQVAIDCQKPLHVEVTADDNILPLIQTDVSNDTLHVHNDKNYSTQTTVVVRIALPTLNAVDCSGAVDVRLQQVKSDKLKIDFSGMGSLDVDGTVQFFDLEASGAASIETAGLKADTVKVDLSGTGSAEVFARLRLDATVSGVGSIRYAGDPKEVHPTMSGVGKVEKL